MTEDTTPFAHVAVVFPMVIVEVEEVKCHALKNTICEWRL
jgi:hypothetical protein